MSRLDLLYGVLLVLGVLVWVRGRLGRAVPAHPACARCGHSLAAAGVEAPERCPECGVELSAPAGIRLGRVEPSRWLTRLGGAVMFIAAFMLGVRLTQHFTGARWATARPTGFVVRDLDRNMTRAAAWQELQRRLEAGELSEAAIDDAFERIVAGIEAGAPDVPGAGGFLSALLAKDRLSGDQRRRLAEAIAHPSLRVEARTRARAGQPLRFVIPAPTAHPYGLDRMFQLRAVRAEDGTALHRSNRRGIRRTPAIGLGLRTFEDQVNVDRLPLGPQTLTFDLEVAVVPYRPSRTSQWSDDMVAVHRWPVEIPWPVEVVPPDARTIEVVRDPALADEIRSWISVTGFRVEPKHGNSFGKIELVIEIRPYEGFVLAFDVIARVNGHRYAMGKARRHARGGSGQGMSMMLDRAPDLIEAGRADVILVPNLAFADDSRGLRTWVGELTFEDVPVLNPEVLETANAPVAE